MQGSVELECSDPALSKGFDSFRHIAGLADRQAVEEGRSLRQKMHRRESKVRPMKQLVWLGHVLLLYDRVCCLMFNVLQRKVVHGRDMEVRQGCLSCWRHLCLQAVARSE